MKLQATSLAKYMYKQIWTQLVFLNHIRPIKCQSFLWGSSLLPTQQCIDQWILVCRPFQVPPALSFGLNSYFRRLTRNILNSPRTKWIYLHTLVQGIASTSLIQLYSFSIKNVFIIIPPRPKMIYLSDKISCLFVTGAVQTSTYDTCNCNMIELHNKQTHE